MSTSSKKCIPPARSKPRFTGLPPIDLSHSGVDGSEFKAIIKSPSEYSAKVLLPANWSSTSLNIIFNEFSFNSIFSNPISLLSSSDAIS